MIKVLFYVGERGDERGPTLSLTSTRLKLKIARSREQLFADLEKRPYDLVILATDDHLAADQIKLELEKMGSIPLLTITPQSAASFRGLARALLAEKNSRDGMTRATSPAGPEAPPSPGPAPVSQLEFSRRFMDENFTRSLSLVEIAGLAGISPSYFCRKFKEVYGMSPVSYLKQLRLSRACHLLERTSLPLSAVTNQSGFFSIPYFCREFKKDKKMSPIQYRRQASSVGRGGVRSKKGPQEKNSSALIDGSS